MSWMLAPGSGAYEWQEQAPAPAMGLLGSLPTNDRTLGLLGIAAGILANNRGRNRGEAFANAIGGGMQGGLGMLQASLANQRSQQQMAMQQQGLDLQRRGVDINEGFRRMQEQQIAAQVEETRRRAVQERTLRDLRLRAGQIVGQPRDLAPTQANADAASAGTLPRMSEMDAVDFLRRSGDFAGAELFQKTMPKNTGAPISAVGPNGLPTLFQGREFGSPVPLGIQPYEQAFDPRKIPQAVAEYSALTPATVAREQALLPVRSAVAAAGATRIPISVNTDRTLAGEVAQIVGQRLGSENTAATEAVGTIRTAQTIQQLVQSGKVIIGPGATPLTFLNQVGQALGVGGKDQAEVLANTRQLMQNLAKSELDAATLMRGQGQITEKERELIRRASAGDQTMTAPELLGLSQALEKTARSKIRTNNERVQQIGQNPQFGIVPQFMTVPEPPPIGQASPQSPNDPQRVRRYNPATGKIE